MVHFAARSDVVVKLDEARELRAEDGTNFFERPGEVIAVVIERDIGILTRVKAAMLAVGKHGIYPAENADGGFAEQWIARDGIAVQIVSQQLGIVVGHLLEMGHQPALIDRISMETAAELIVNAAAGHFFERGLHSKQQLRVAGGLIAFEEQVDGGRVREFGAAAKSAVVRVEMLEDGARQFVDYCRCPAAARSLEKFCLLHGVYQSAGG